MSIELYQKIKSINSVEVIERLCDVFEVNSHSALGTMLGKAPSAISQMKNRNTIPFDICALACLEKNVTMDYLLFGDKHISNEISEGVSKPFDKSCYIHNFKETIVKGIQMNMLAATEYTDDKTLELLANNILNSTLESGNSVSDFKKASA